MATGAKIDLRALAGERAVACGFDLAGVARVEDFPELRRFGSWIAEERAGEMHYLAARGEAGRLKRAAVENAAPWAKSAIVCGAIYNAAAPFSTEAADERAAWISRYAWFQSCDGDGNTDYHEVLLARLRRLESEVVAAWPSPVQTRAYVDTGPIVERVLAKYAGLGWIAKNTCVINEAAGSFFFLGVILTSIELPPDHVNLPAPDRCGSCTRCIDACPTQAITAPYELDPRRCISYLTIEKRGEMPEPLRSGVGRHVFGCDICQDVCPWNGGVTGERPPVARLPEFTPRPELINPDLTELAQLTPEGFRKRFRRSPVKRAKYANFMRNVAVALGNSRAEWARAPLELLAGHADAVIASHARWALAQLPAQSSNSGESSAGE